MKVLHILATTATTLWALFLLIGLSLIGGVRSQNVPGYPSTGQLTYCIYIPICVLAVVIAAWILGKHKALRLCAIVLISFILAALFPYFLGLGGGV